MRVPFEGRPEVGRATGAVKDMGMFEYRLPVNEEALAMCGGVAIDNILSALATTRDPKVYARFSEFLHRKYPDKVALTHVRFLRQCMEEGTLGVDLLRHAVRQLSQYTRTPVPRTASSGQAFVPDHLSEFVSRAQERLAQSV